MSFKIKERDKNRYVYFQISGKGDIFLAKEGELSNNPERVLETLNYVKQRYDHYTDTESRLIAFLPSQQKEQYISKRLKELETEQKHLLYLSPSAAKQYKSRGKKTAEGETRPRQIIIAGFNLLGKLFASELQKLKMNVLIYDDNFRNLIEAKVSGFETVSKEIALQRGDIFVNCLNKALFSEGIANLVKNDVIIVEASSTYVDRDWLDENSDIVTTEENFLNYQIGKKNIHLHATVGAWEERIKDAFLMITGKKIFELPLSTEDLMIIESQQKSVGRKSMSLFLSELTDFHGTREELSKNIQKDLHYAPTEAEDLIEKMIEKQILNKPKNQMVAVTEKGKKTIHVFSDFRITSD